MGRRKKVSGAVMAEAVASSHNLVACCSVHDTHTSSSLTAAPDFLIYFIT